MKWYAVCYQWYAVLLPEYSEVSEMVRGVATRRYAGCYLITEKEKVRGVATCLRRRNRYVGYAT